MKKISFKKQSSRVLFRFTVSYLLLMVIPVLIGFTAYSIALRSVEEQVIRTNELALERASSEIECSLTEADSFIASLTGLEVVDQLFSGTQEASFLQSAISSLPDFQDTYRLMQRYFIYIPEQTMIIDHRNAYLQLKNYYMTAFRYGEMSLTEFRQNILDGASARRLLPVTDNTYMQKNYHSMLYVQRLVTPSRKSGKVFFYLDEDALLQRLHLHFDTGIAFTGICRSDGETLLSTNPEMSEAIFSAIPEQVSTGSFRMKGEGHLVSYHYLDILQACLVVAVPQKVVSDQMSSVLTTMITGLSLMLIIGLALALTLFFHNRRPLAAAIESLPSPQDEQNARGLNWLEYAVRDLTESHEQLEASIRLQRVELQNAAIHRLINGGEKTESGIEELLEYVGIHLNGDWFRAVLVRVGSDDSWNESMTPSGELRRTNLRHILSTFEPGLIVLGLQNQNTFALIEVGQEENQPDQEIYHQVYQKLLEAGETSAIISVGPVQHMLVALYRSFTVADQQMERAQDGSWLLTGTERRGNEYHFTMHDEQKLGNLAVNSAVDEVEAALDHLWEENFVRRNVTGFERELLYYRVMDTAIQASGNPDLMKEEKHLIAEMSPEDFFRMIREKFRLICESMKEKRLLSSNTLLDSVIAYVNRYFADCETCLASTAMHFGLTEKYLSAFFKEKAGVNFSAYLEDLRMRKAFELLRSTAMTIEEISRAVGYNSAKSFSRAFYRREGVTPSQAREPGKVIGASGNDNQSTKEETR